MADENYFSTMLMNSPYCKDNIQKNLIFVVFDKWEHERNYTRNPRKSYKCLHIDPNQCGRSPTTLTMEFKHLISSSRSLFARKFDYNDISSLELLEYIDTMRNGRGPYQNGSSESWDHNKDNNTTSSAISMIQVDENYLDKNHSSKSSTSLSLITANDSANRTDLCLEYTEDGPHYIRMMECDATKATQWFKLSKFPIYGSYSV